MSEGTRDAGLPAGTDAQWQKLCALPEILLPYAMNDFRLCNFPIAVGSWPSMRLPETTNFSSLRQEQISLGMTPERSKRIYKSLADE